MPQTGPVETMIARASLAHAEAMALIHAAAFAPGEQWPAAAFAGQLGLPGVLGWVAPAGGLILARVAADEAEILTLAVAPDARRAGLGRALMACAMAAAEQAGARSMVLEVAAGNGPARRLYASLGFGEVGQRRRYYPGGGDAVILRADLPSGSTAA